MKTATMVRVKFALSVTYAIMCFAFIAIGLAMAGYEHNLVSLLWLAILVLGILGILNIDKIIGDRRNLK